MKKTQIFIFQSFLIILLFTGFNLKAEWYSGGEITWDCLPNGQFQFHLKIYNECGSCSAANSATLQSSSPAGNIYLGLESGWPKEITPKGNSYSGCTLITCAWVAQNGYDNTGAVKEYRYISVPVTINGVPPSNGWEFYYDNCCWKPSTNLLNQPGWKLMAIMYPFNNQNTYPCFDSSPYFAETMTSIVGTKYEATINNSAIDSELDSLVYSWGRLRDNYGSTINSYMSGYSYDSPFPSQTHNSNNIAPSVDQNGIIHLKSYNIGAFAISSKVSAYKSGVLVSEIYRTYMSIIDDNTNNQGFTNTPPYVQAPFDSSTSFSSSVYIGDTLYFPIIAIDTQYSIQNPNNYQSINMWVTSSHLGGYYDSVSSHYSQLNGCNQPPCAILTPVNNDTLSGNGYTGTFLYWETNCNHIINSTSSLKKFYINVKDNMCPFPAIRSYTVEINLKAKPKIESPKISCIKVLNNGEVEIKWNKIQDTLNSFKNFNLYLWDSNNSTLADSVYDISDYQDTIQNINANTSSKSIYMNTVSSCYFETPAYDTVSTMFLEATENINGTIELNWNPIRNDNQQHIYKIYKEYPVGNWTLYNTTVNTSFTDNTIYIGEIVNYYIETEDSVITNTGSYMCNSMSNKTSIIATSIKDSELENQITIYPNPADDIITIEYVKLRINKLEVYNSNSKLVFQESELASNSYKLNPDNLASGTYFLKFFVEDKTVYKKLIIK